MALMLDSAISFPVLASTTGLTLPEYPDIHCERHPLLDSDSPIEQIHECT